ncbi:hypothetical protein O181_021164 [Austropuccinia psidii MF-1]|uniref:RNase H type-1 domain-containing protein n=1 Tax=Austropuccinia psidii MF-1 TaxID=1389203 RepID=A0A9Q3GWE7_9BASI|nr:hypothetical protein [Austropuccinia psidii MF-1]
MMRQTPVAFLKHYGNVPNFSTQHTKLTHNYIHRKLTGPSNDPTTEMIKRELPLSPASHPSPLHQILEKEDLLKSHQTKCKTILTLPVPPWAQPIGPIENLSLTKDQAKKVLANQVQEELRKGTLVLFSDGSLLPQVGGGAAAILVNTGQEKTAYTGRDSLISNFETELTALLLCQDLTRDHISTTGYPKAAAFFSDNQAALMGAALPKKNSTAQNLQLKLYTTLQEWAKQFPIRLYWCPGHAGIPENEKVDALAKLAAESKATSAHTISTISLSKLKQHTMRKLTHNPLTPEETTRIGFKTPPKLIIKALDQLEKGPAATIHQLRTGHVPLNDYLHRIKQTDSPLCKHCNERETPHHYLIACPKFKKQRDLFTMKVAKHRLKLNPKSLKSVLDSPLAYPLLAQYITATKRFQYIQNYLPTPTLDP